MPYAISLFRYRAQYFFRRISCATLPKALYLHKISLYMKRTFLCLSLLVAFLTANIAYGQIPVVSKVTKSLPKVKLGLKVGANFQNLNSNSTFQNSYKGGVVGGAFLDVTKNKVGVQIEGLVKTVKYSVSDAVLGKNAKSDINTVYLDVPVLFEYRLVPRIWLQVGPQFSSMLSAKNGSTDVKTSFNTTDFSGVLGFQAILPVHFIAGARYVYGFSDINNSNKWGADALHNRSFQIFAGWRFL